MKHIIFDDRILIPADKIVAVYKDNEKPNKLHIWLVGGFIQTVSHITEDEADDTFRTIKDLIKEI